MPKGSELRYFSETLTMKNKSFLNLLIAAAVLIGTAGCAQIKKPAAEVRSALGSIKSAGFRYMPVSRAHPKSCSIFTALDQRCG